MTVLVQRGTLRAGGLQSIKRLLRAEMPGESCVTENIAAHGVNPSLEVYACEPTGALDAVHSVRENRIVPMATPRTIAEGLRTSLGDVTLPILRNHLAGFFPVEEKEIVEAMRFAFERLKIAVEPSSAVALAPLLRREEALIGKRVGAVKALQHRALTNLSRALGAEAYPVKASLRLDERS